MGVTHKGRARRQEAADADEAAPGLVLVGFQRLAKEEKKYFCMPSSTVTTQHVPLPDAGGAAIQFLDVILRLPERKCAG
jgi:hypothetical protein